MAVSYKDINQLSQKSQVAGTEKLPVSDTQYITPNQIAALAPGGDTSDCVHKTGDETVGGDKTFTDNIGVVDADHIVYSGGGGGGGFTRGSAYTLNSSAANSIAFTGLLGEPKAFVVTIFDPGGTGAKVVAIVADSTGLHGVYNTGSQHNYSAGFTKSYSNGTLTVNAPSGVTFAEATGYGLVYYYGDGTLTFKTSTIQPGSGVTAVTFTGTDLTEMPVMYATFLESAVNNESYRRVACYTNSSYDPEEEVERSFGATFFSNNAPADTTSSFTATYQTGYSAGLNINSGGTNAGGYFHNPGTYVLYYLMASDVAGGGGGGFQSLGDELDDIRDTISGIETLLAAI